ncbi:hypothetical protein PG988_003564 [Apiospora saccharicola]
MLSCWKIGRTDGLPVSWSRILCSVLAKHRSHKVADSVFLAREPWPTDHIAQNGLGPRNGPWCIDKSLFPPGRSSPFTSSAARSGNISHTLWRLWTWYAKMRSSAIDAEANAATNSRAES